MSVNSNQHETVQSHAELLYNDYSVSLARRYVKSQQKTKWVTPSSGYVSSVMVVDGFGWLRLGNTLIELKPGRVLDYETYKLHSNIEFEASTGNGIVLIETTSRILA